mmetsp:Transcript_12078/g.41063  ORF Transcript_12078/g.41063 Transcript_12078/m.41063 type:complete len:234 (+) Transcript_12078:274-975(+)
MRDHGHCRARPTHPGRPHARPTHTALPRRKGQGGAGANCGSHAPPAGRARSVGGAELVVVHLEEPRVALAPALAPLDRVEGALVEGPVVADDDDGVPLAPKRADGPRSRGHRRVARRVELRHRPLRRDVLWREGVGEHRGQEGPRGARVLGHRGVVEARAVGVVRVRPAGVSRAQREDVHRAVVGGHRQPRGVEVEGDALDLRVLRPPAELVEGLPRVRVPHADQSAALGGGG